jgi:No apical meristem-associated C-terminal domain
MARPVLVPDALSDPAHVEAMRLIAEGASVAVIPAGQGKKKRSPNWFPWEDLMVAKAWVNVSMDASIGCNQTVAKFWRRVQQKFMLQFLSYQVRESHDGGDKDHGGRTASQITNRFMKVMKADMTLFNKYFKEIKDENPSGVPYKQHVKLAVERYNHLNKDPFKFQHCVPTFHKCPKFCPFENDDARIRMMGRDSLGEVDDEEEASTRTANHVGSVMGGNLERPIGRKAAKKVARTEKKRKSYTSKVEASKTTSPENSTLTEEESSNTSVTIADAMTTLSNAVQANSYFDRMERMVRLNTERGNHADADRTMVELNAYMAAEGRSTLAAARNGNA